MLISFCLFRTDFVQSQRYPEASFKKREYFNFKAKNPAAAKSHFVPKKRRTRAHDLKQLTKILKKVYPEGIGECSYDGFIFPLDFKSITDPLSGNATPDYPALEGTMTSCMEALNMKIPKYPLN